jgi:hypothetical protein
MFADDPAVLSDHNTIGIGVNINGAPHRTGAHRILVVVETHQSGLGRWRRVESIKPAGIGHKPRALRLVDIPDRPLAARR